LDNNSTIPKPPSKRRNPRPQLRPPQRPTSHRNRLRNPHRHNTGAVPTLSTLSDSPDAGANSWPDGIVANIIPIIGSYVHGLFDSREILRRLLNTTAETHNLPEPRVTEFSMEAEYDRLAQTVSESIYMNLINALIK